MTNFDFLKKEKQFESFADVAVSAENLLHIDIDACVLNCRRAMEFAVKWMYSVDRELVTPYQDTLVALMNDKKFRDIVGEDIWQRMDLIRKIGNAVAHEGKKVTLAQAELCLENLFYYLDQVAYFYADEYTEHRFDRAQLELTPEEALSFVSTDTQVDLGSLLEENRAMKAELTARRNQQQQTYVPHPLALAAYETRRIYIESMLEDAGWTEGRDWQNDVELSGPAEDKAEAVRADHVLYGTDGRPLAVLEARAACSDLAKGREKAGLYADILERSCGRRPVIFLTDGFETRIIDGLYPERRVAAVYSRRDLEKLFALRDTRLSLADAAADKNIAGRYYQAEAVRAVCDAFAARKSRGALLAMAAGSGKTRTVIALIDLLRQRGWIKNVLFLAERSSLVTQARRSFESMLPELEVADAGRDPENYGANCVFSTYQALASVIDTARDGQGRVFTCGHFDLVICDEVHRSVYYRYRDIFTYFDALLVGLSATPKDDIDEDIYKLFGLEKGAPTYAYGLSRAVGDGYLVDFMSVDTRVKFIEPGVAYDDLSEQERKTCEQLPAQGGAPDGSGLSAALREWLFNEDTIREALRVLREYGLKIDHGKELGKTIIFAQDHAHAEKILAVFGKEYPGAEGFAAVIDNDTPHVQRAIDAFADPRKLPRIAISADALDSGIDIPDVLNLVFFKKVTSKDRFWQMIGRGTRLCSELMDGKDKEKFYIFDFCGNFEFFRMERKGAAESGPALAGVVFMLKAQIARSLQELPYQTQELNEYREKLTGHMARKVSELDRENFAVRQHLRSAETYAAAESYQTLTDEDIQTMGQEIAPLITADGEDDRALRFDALMYSLELTHLCGREKAPYLDDLRRLTESIATVKDTPKIKAQDKLLRKILESSFAAEADIGGLERIRKNLRGLIKYVPLNKVGYETAAGEALKAEK